MKRIAIILVMAFVFVAGVNAQQYINVKRACPQCMGYGAANNGTYTRTSCSVTVYTEDGYKKGNYAIYLHGGQKYISFSNTWICIQGKSRFGYNGNWYVIK